MTRSWMLALPVVVLIVYAPSLDGGLLNYDDDWLIERNEIVHAPAGQAMPSIWTDLSLPTRSTLGLEFLPVRDTSIWIDVRLLGGAPWLLRAMNLVIYLVGLLFLRGLLRLVMPPEGEAGAAAEIALWLFALHPAHAESVAWIAGRKDVLAMMFVSAALYVHARDRRHAIVTVPLLLVLAMLSKGVAVVGPLLLPLIDLARRRRVAWWPALAALVGVAVVLVVQLRVGHQGGIVHATLGSDRLAVAASMGPIFARYVLRSFVPVGLSVAHDVRIYPASALDAWLGYLPLASWIAAGVWAWRVRGRRAVLLAALWFVVTLAPTSQILVPLQNVEADRYLLLPVLGPCVLLALGLAWLARGLAVRREAALAMPLAALFAVLTAWRGVVFSDSVTLWRDALAKTKTRTLVPYQLGMALDAAGERGEAYGAFAEVTRRDPGSADAASATGHLTRLLFADGHWDEAVELLREGVRQFPATPKLLGNLAAVLADSPDPARRDEGRRLFEDLLRRFPDYEFGRRNYEQRYGRLP